MQKLLLALWVLPWPPWLRRRLEPLAMLAPVQRLLIPHFRCGVVGLIRNDRGEFLLFKHTYRQRCPWGLPTGYMEHGEQPADALLREIQEESGLVVDLERVWKVYTDSRSIVNIVFRGRAREFRFTPSAEISQAQYCAAGNLPPMIPDQRHLLEASEKEDHNQELA